MWRVVRRSVVFGACSDWEEMQSSGKSHRSTSSDGSQARLSRRSSVLVDLLSLFRKSSSVARTSPVRLPGQNLIEPARDAKEVEETEAFLHNESEDEDSKPMSREKLLEQIRQKKEVIGKLRGQPWSMRRKRRTLKLAQRYLQRHESKVSKTHLYREEVKKRWHNFLRWLKNVQIYLIPWEAKIKRIESHFGSVVSSYFTFLRWVLGVNVTMTFIMVMFVTIPEMLSDAGASEARYNTTYSRKVMPEQVRKQSDELHTVWNYGGHMQYSLLFYGYYGSQTYMGDTVQYSVPVAYFISFLFVLGYSFFTILRKMASNARSSKMASGKAEQYVFNWNVFAGWDYTIGNPETAGNAVMAHVNKLRETIAEYQVKQKKKFLWIHLAARIATNAIFLTMLALSVWAIHAVSQITDKDTFLKQNAVSITVSFITLVFPNIFELVGRTERYHPRTALRIQLARVLSLYIVNYYTLILSLFLMRESLKDTMEAREQFSTNRFKRSNFDVSNDSVLGEALLSAAMPNNDSLLWSILTRTTRQAVDLGSKDSAYYGYTTAPTPWTTMLPNFGPMSVHGLKVIVENNVSPLIDTNASSFETRPMGPGSDWSQPLATRGLNTSQYGGILHNFTQKPAVAQRITSDSFDDLCWETMIGQEITKLVTMDLLMTIASVFLVDFFRGLWVRYCSQWWCWNLETVFPEYGEFKVAENVLHLVNNQGMIWLGLFFVPLLPAINNIKLIILMYIRGWAVMTCNVPAQQIFRASRSSNFYLMLLLLMLFLCTLPVGFVIASEKPSNSCGPFGNKHRFYQVITDVLQMYLSRSILDILHYATSPGIVIPVLLLLLLVIYFLFALVRGLREANTDLQMQLTHERTEEKRKIFQLAGGRGRKRTVHHNDFGESTLEHSLEQVESGTDETKGEMPSSSSPELERSTRSLVTSSSPTLLAPPNVRSMTQSKHFIPSLGSLHEDDNTSELDDDKISGKHSSHKDNSMNRSGSLSIDETIKHSGSNPKLTSRLSPVDTVDFRCANSKSLTSGTPPKRDAWDSTNSKESETSFIYTEGSRIIDETQVHPGAGSGHTTPTPRAHSISSMSPSFTPQDLEQLIGRSTPLTRSLGDGQSHASSPLGALRTLETMAKQAPESDFGAFVASGSETTLPTPLTPADVVLCEPETTDFDESGTDYISTDDRRPLTKRQTPKDSIYRPMNRYPATSMTDQFVAWPAPPTTIQQTSIESEEPDERLKWASHDWHQSTPRDVVDLQVKRKPRFRISTSPTRRVSQDSSDTDSSAKRKFIIRTAPAIADDTPDDEHRLLPELHAPPKSGAYGSYRAAI